MTGLLSIPFIQDTTHPSAEAQKLTAPEKPWSVAIGKTVTGWIGTVIRVVGLLSNANIRTSASAVTTVRKA
jgi:hypothetical protein